MTERVCDMYAVLTQFTGLMAACALFGAYQFKENKNLFLWQMVSQILWVVHFAMLGAFSGAALLVISVMRCFVLWGATKNWRWAQQDVWLAVLILGCVFAMVMTWKGFFSVLLFISTVAATVAAWFRNGRTIRIVKFSVSTPIWLAYDYATNSLSGIACELFTLASVVISIWRYGWKALDVRS